MKKTEYILYLCEKKLKQLNLQDKKEYIDRLDKEIINIDVQSIQDYILTALQNGIKIPQHSSLVYYLLDISESDPIKLGLKLKIKKQSSFPDIDSDFSMEERDKVVQYFIQKYGSDHVAPIGSYGQMKMKMVTRDIARILDINLAETGDVVKNLGDDVDTMTPEDFESTITLEPGQDGFRQDLYDLRQYFAKYPQVREILFTLKGQLRHLTKHPAGVVATPGKIDESIPLMRHKNELITSWVDGIIRKDLQSSGFIKFDILGLKTLTIIKQILELIRNKKHYNKDADFDLESIDKGQLTSLLYEDFSTKLPLDGNDSIYDRFRNTDTNGIFQFECVAGQTWIGNYRIEELYNKFEKDPMSVHKIGCATIGKERKRIRKRTRRWFLNMKWDIIGSKKYREPLQKRKIRQRIKAMKKQKRMVWLLALKSGQCILATPLHKFYFRDRRRGYLHGWRKLENLRVGDKIVIDNERGRSQHYCKHKNIVVEQPRDCDACKKCTVPPKERKCKLRVLNEIRDRVYKRRFALFEIDVIIKDWAEIDVYDIGFDENDYHNYIANGFLVHNSNLMKSLLKEIKPTSFSDITTATALGRPGPLDMGMHHEYAARKHGKDFDFGSPVIEKCLKESFGILVYQEDVMRLCHMVAGFPLDLTDTVRKNLMKSIRDTDAKDKSAKERQKIKKMFIEGFVENGLTEKVAELWWQNCLSFARYGFNKSHAVAYTILSYHMMWFKVYYPLEFYVVLFSNSLTDKFSFYFAEAMSKGINIVPADINKANDGFTIHGDNEIMFGLGHIMGVGPAVVNNIQATRPYESFIQFWDRTAKIKKIGKSAMLALINAHAFDCFGNQNDIYKQYYIECRKEKKWEMDVDFNDRKFEHEKFVESYTIDWRTKLSDKQKEILRSLEAKNLSKLVNPHANMKRYVWGVISEIVEKESKSGNKYYYVYLTDSKFNNVKVRIPLYNRRCKKAFVLDHGTGKYKKVDVEEVLQKNNLLTGDAETSEYMSKIFIDLYEIVCIGNIYEKSVEQKEKLAKYDRMYKEE